MQLGARKNIYLQTARSRRLRALAETSGVSESEIIGRALDDYFEKHPLPAKVLELFDAKERLAAELREHSRMTGTVVEGRNGEIRSLAGVNAGQGQHHDLAGRDDGGEEGIRTPVSSFATKLV